VKVNFYKVAHLFKHILKDPYESKVDKDSRDLKCWLN